MRRSALMSAAVVLLAACAHVDAPPSEVRVSAPLPEEADATESAAARASAPEPPRRTDTPKSPPRIDSTSLASFRRSWQELYGGLSPAEQARLTSAAAAIAFAPYRGATNVPLDLRYSPIVPEMVRDQIDGMTYLQIIELSRKSAGRSESSAR